MAVAGAADVTLRARRRAPRFATWGFKPLAVGDGCRRLVYQHRGAGRATHALKHWHRIAQLSAGERIVGEIGWFEGFRFITSPALP